MRQKTFESRIKVAGLTTKKGKIKANKRVQGLDAIARRTPSRRRGGQI